MNFYNVVSIICVLSPFVHMTQGFGGNSFWFNNPVVKLLENQLETASREQQQLATRLIQNGVQQAQAAVNQLQANQLIQNAAANTLAAKGIFDLGNIGRLILSWDVRQCYEKNGFSFSNAINTAKIEASKCINEKLNQGKSILDSARNSIQSAVQNIGTGARLMANCSQITSIYPSVAGVVAKMACYNQALIIIRSNTILLPISIAKHMLQITEAVSSLEADIVKCNLNIVSTILSEASRAGQAIVDCINGQNGYTPLASGTTIENSNATAPSLPISV